MQGGPDGRVSEKRRIAQFVPHFFNLSGAVSHIGLDFTNIFQNAFSSFLCGGSGTQGTSLRYLGDNAPFVGGRRPGCSRLSLTSPVSPELLCFWRILHPTPPTFRSPHFSLRLRPPPGAPVLLIGR